MSKKIKIFLILATVFTLVSISTFFSTQKKSPSPNLPLPTGETLKAEGIKKLPKPTPKPLSKLSPSEKTESITIIAGEEKINLSIPQNTTFYNALIQIKDAGNLKFTGKNYTGLGFFVTEIGELRAGNGKDLLYYINGKEANVGVSSYVPKDGDIIEWKLK